MKKPIIIVSLAVVLNIVMFLSIQAMVVQKRVKLADVSDFQMATFIRTPEANPPPPRKNRELPDKPQQPKKAETQQVLDNISGSNLQISPTFDFGFDASIGTPKIFLDSDLVAIVRVPPNYPQRAVFRNIGGHVDVLYTVTETGLVTKPIVLAAEPEGIFEKSALQAIARWKYQPVLQDGKPISITAKVRIIFKFDENYIE